MYSLALKKEIIKYVILAQCLPKIGYYSSKNRISNLESCIDSSASLEFWIGFKGHQQRYRPACLWKNGPWWLPGTLQNHRSVPVPFISLIRSLTYLAQWTLIMPVSLLKQGLLMLISLLKQGLQVDTYSLCESSCLIFSSTACRAAASDALVSSSFCCAASLLPPSKEELVMDSLGGLMGTCRG